MFVIILCKKMNSLFIMTIIMLGSSLSSPLNNCRCNDPQLSGQELSKTAKQEPSINTDKVQEKRHSVKINQEVLPEVEVKIQNNDKLANHQGLNKLASYNNQQQGDRLEEEQSKMQPNQNKNQKRQKQQPNVEYEYYVDENEDLDNGSSNKRNADHENDEGADAYYYDSAPPVRKKRLNKEWDEWGAWSPCSVSCGTGKSISWRHCKAGGCEPGDKEAKIKICNTNACFY